MSSSLAFNCIIAMKRTRYQPSVSPPAVDPGKVASIASIFTVHFIRSSLVSFHSFLPEANVARKSRSFGFDFCSYLK